MKKVLGIIILVMISAVLVMLTNYVRPRTIKEEYSLTSLEGETVNAVFDLKIYKQKNRRKIITNNVEYGRPMIVENAAERGEHEYCFSEIKNEFDIRFDNYL